MLLKVMIKKCTRSSFIGIYYPSCIPDRFVLLGARRDTNMKDKWQHHLDIPTKVPSDIGDLGSVCLGTGNSLLTVKDYNAPEVGISSTWTLFFLNFTRMKML